MPTSRRDAFKLVLAGTAAGAAACPVPPSRQYTRGVEGQRQADRGDAGEEHAWMRQSLTTPSVRIKLTNIRNVVTFHYSHDGVQWTQHPWQMEVSGFHHNVFGGFLSLRIGIYSAGTGAVTLRNFTYRGLGA